MLGRGFRPQCAGGSRPPLRSDRRLRPACWRSGPGRGCSRSTSPLAWAADGRSGLGKRCRRRPAAAHAFDFSGKPALAAGCLGLFIIGIGSAAHKASTTLVSIELVGRHPARLDPDPKGRRIIRRRLLADRPVFGTRMFSLSRPRPRSARFAVQGFGVRRIAVLFRRRPAAHPGRDRISS